MTFDEWYDERLKLNQRGDLMDAWNAALESAAKVALTVGEDAHEAAKAKDATDYVAGYQDAAVDVQQAIMELAR